MYVEPIFPRARPLANLSWTVERVRGTTTAMARTKHGHPPRILFHPHQRHMLRGLDARFGGTGRQQFLHLVFLDGLCTRVAEQALGSVMAVL